MSTRRYRMDATGQERPVWAGHQTLADLGREWGRKAFEAGASAPINTGNLAHDKAARAEFARLTGKPSK